MGPRLILGFGNPLRSDDGVGWKAAAVLARELSSSDVVVLTVYQLTPELAEVVSRCSRILFLNAAHTGQPGEIRMDTVRRDPQFQSGVISQQLSPQALLELAYRHFGAEPDATLLSMTGENFDLGERFSAAVEQAWNPFLERIRAWIRGS